MHPTLLTHIFEATCYGASISLAPSYINIVLFVNAFLNSILDFFIAFDVNQILNIECQIGHAQLTYNIFSIFFPDHIVRYLSKHMRLCFFILAFINMLPNLFLNSGLEPFIDFSYAVLLYYIFDIETLINKCILIYEKFNCIDLNGYFVFLFDENGFAARYQVVQPNNTVSLDFKIYFYFYIIFSNYTDFDVDEDYIVFYLPTTTFAFTDDLFCFNQIVYLTCVDSIFYAPSLIQFSRSDFYVSPLTFPYRSINFGHFLYIIQGGESNPGPIFSRMFHSIGRYVAPTVYELHERVQQSASHTGKSVLSVLYLHRLVDSFFDVISEMFSRFASSALSFYNRLLIFCLNIYDTYKMIIEQMGLKITFSRPQSGPLEHFSAAAFLASIIPNNLKFILRDIPLFTSFKLLDDSTWVFDIFGFVLSIPRLILENICNPDIDMPVVYSFLKSFENLFPFGQLGKFSYLSRSFIEELEKNPHFINNKDFQTRFLSFHEKYATFKSSYLSSKSPMPKFMLENDQKITSYYKNITYLNTSSRPEPVCLVFYGPAGTGKTTLVREMLAHWEEHNSVYQHISEERDFFDQYTNQDIFCYDDIGQKGTYQWSNLINMVSTLKCPLNCAEARLKGTKQFTSKVLMLTTNKIDITLTPDCGITDKNALFRRLKVFDFTRVQMRIGDDGIRRFSGDLIFKKFNIYTTEWENIEVFNLNEIDMVNVKLYIHKYVAQNIQANEAVVNQTQNFNSFPSFSNPASFESATPNTFFELISSTKTSFLNVISYIQSCMPDYEKASKFLFDFATSDHFILITVASAFLYIFYNCFDKMRDNAEEINIKNINKHYQSDKYEKIKLDQVMPQSLADIYSLKNDVVIPQLCKYKSQTMVAQFSFMVDGKYRSEVTTVVLSGKHFSAPFHCFNFNDTSNDEIFVTIFSGPNTVLYDKAYVKPVWFDRTDDIIIFSFPDAMPAYTSLIKIPERSSNFNLFLVTPQAIHTLDTLRMTDIQARSYHPRSHFSSTISGDTHTFYNVNMDGICGSFLVNNDGYLIGHHVAVVTSNLTPFGTSRIFSKNTIDNIRKYFSTPPSHVINIRNPYIEMPSANIVDTQEFSHIPSKTTYSQSEIYGVFDALRKPAEIEKYANKTAVLELTKANFEIATEIDLTPMPYVDKCLMELLPQDPVPFFNERNLVLGDMNLDRIDPKTSTGYGISGVKHDYLDYENGIIKQPLKDLLYTLFLDITNKNFKYDTYFVATLKDELRNTNEIGCPKQPRVFTAGNLTLTVAYRGFLGTLFSSIFSDKWRNGVMVGINPFSNDWAKLAKQHLNNSGNEHNRSFDGDYEKWDKGMLPQFQRHLNKVVKAWLEKHDQINKAKNLFNNLLSINLSSSDYSFILDTLLEIIISTPILIYNLTLIKSHGMPSGIAVTSFFNSLINRMYTSYAYYVLYKNEFGSNNEPTVAQFFYDITDSVYGDDKLVTVNPKNDWFDALSYKSVMDNLKIGFTSAEKTEIKSAFKNFYSCTFLKRSFAYHSQLNKIVAPLELRSMCSTLNYVKDDFRNTELTIVKAQNFQREAFLHENHYSNFLQKLESKLSEIDLHVTFLSNESLIELYNAGDYGINIDFS